MNNKNRAMIIPVFNTVIYPGSKTKLKVNSRMAKILNEYKGSSEITTISLTVKSKDSKSIEELNKDDFYEVGTALIINEIKKTEDGYTVYVQGLSPVNIVDIELEENLQFSVYSDFNLQVDITKNEEIVLLNKIKKHITETGKKFKGAEDFILYLDKLHDLDRIIESLISFMEVSITDKQLLLTSPTLKNKYLNFIDILAKNDKRIDLQIELSQKTNETATKQYRKTLLKEQMKTIQKELDEGQESGDKFEEYRTKIKESSMPSDIEKVALSEVQKLENVGLNGSESSIIQNYLDLLIELPWNTIDTTDINIEEAKNILNEQHFGLDKVKERIIQHLAVLKLKKEKQGSIILLVGPPGTGKTSLGKSIAKALGREYVRASLGGVRDEAEIRGHRRTYIGALPGRIISGIKKAKSKNPVFILDEIDKLSQSNGAAPFSALLEVLDPEQNNSFSDHYLEVPYDLSDVLFIATANSTNTIPAPLLDRMEVIEISSYTNSEKFHIAKNHLVPEIYEDHGVLDNKITISDNVINTIINNYTREAGVRGLKKKITQIVRYCSVELVSNSTVKPYEVNSENITDILGNEKIRHDRIKDKNLPGIVTGLAWTPVGGEILFIETAVMKGKGNLILTGQLGDVMKESAIISSSLIRSKLFHLTGNFNFDENDIHIHVPSGATPKDGPSAGISLFTSLVSLLIGQSVSSEIAMTGELTLRGDVLPIGGVKEKVLAAHRAGIKHVLLPKDNTEDIKDIPEDIREQLKFSFVETIEDVLKITLDLDITLTPQIFTGSQLIIPATV